MSSELSHVLINHSELCCGPAVLSGHPTPRAGSTAETPYSSGTHLFDQTIFAPVIEALALILQILSSKLNFKHKQPCCL